MYVHNLTTTMNLTTISLTFSYFVEQNLFLLICNRMTTYTNPPSTHWRVHIAPHFVFPTFDRVFKTSPALNFRSACVEPKGQFSWTAQGNMKRLQKRRKQLAIFKQQLSASMLSAGFEREILPKRRPQTYTLDRTAIGFGL